MDRRQDMFWQRYGILILGLLLGGLSACVSLQSGSEQGEKPPEIHADMPLPEALEAGITFGDETLVKVKRLVDRRGLGIAATNQLYDWIKQHEEKWPATKLINAVHLYQLYTPKEAPELFHLLSQAERNLSQQLAWHLAAAIPSQAMAAKIESKLTQAIADNEIGNFYWPKLAEAIANNRLVQDYTVVRQGLFESNHVAFARAMIALNPKRASEDFMDYLAQAPVEELRQLSLESVDIFACLEILQHLASFPVAVSHPRFEHLFFYAISRNTALSEMARKLLEQYLPSQGNHLAFMLARMPNWVQIAFVEGVRRQLTPQLSLFLRELKRSTSEKDVIEEIDHVVR